MVLVDTSVWVDHFRRGSETLAGLLEGGSVLCHPFVIGELSCCNLGQRTETLSLLSALDCAPLVDQDETLAFVENRRLMSLGIGWIDMHLLASTLLARATLWTLDRRLSDAARELGV